MNWLKTLLEAAVIKDGELDVDALMTSVNAEFPKHAVPKDTYNDLAKAKKQLDTDLSDRDKQLKILGDTEGLSQKLQYQIDKMQNDNKETKIKHEAEKKELRLNNAIKLAIHGKVHDEDLAAGLIDKEKLVIGDDGKVVGLDEQVTSLQESKSFLFKSNENNQQDQNQPGFKVGGDGQGSPPSDKPVSLGAAIAQRISK